jgi:multiple sugar transport system substrate-binding protein
MAISERMMRGMTWDHPRGYRPMLAAAQRWHDLTGVGIEWDRRSLQDFESYPVEVLARRYDLIVIDHPHVGIVAETGALMPFEEGLEDIARGSVGGSFDSYRWAGRQWALPIDAAAQVQAWAPDRIAAAPASWTEVIALARAGRVALPLRPPHSLMSLMTLCGLSGLALDAEADRLFPDDARLAVERLAELAALVAPDSDRLDPIAVLEDMARPRSPIAAAPLIYGYVSYAEAGFRPVRLAFADLPTMGAAGPAGSVLGGTGIAVSAYSSEPDSARAFARWIASGVIQRDLVVPHGGQPAHADAWEADAANAATLDFYRATRRTLDRAWVRPRRAGYVASQHAAAERINAALRTGERPAQLVEALNVLLSRPNMAAPHDARAVC